GGRVGGWGGGVASGRVAARSRGSSCVGVPIVFIGGSARASRRAAGVVGWGAGVVGWGAGLSERDAPLPGRGAGHFGRTARFALPKSQPVVVARGHPFRARWAAGRG